MKLSRHLITILVLGIAVYLIIPKIVGGDEALRVLSLANPSLLVAAFLLQVLSWSSDAGINRTLLTAIRQHLRFFDLVRISSLEVFASHCLPVAGLGFSVSNMYFFKRQGLPGQAAFLLVVMRNLFVNLAFVTLFLLSLAAVSAHPVIGLTSKITGILSSAVGALVLFLSVFFYFHKSSLFRVAHITVKLTNKITLKFLRKTILEENKIDTGLTDIYSSLEVARAQIMHLPLAFLFAILYHLAGVGCLYFVFLSLGYQPPTGALLLGYFLPMFSAMITPGGLGLYEGAMGAIYLSYQFPRSETLMAVLIYRFLSFWLPIPLGFLSYLSLQYQKKRI